MWRISLVKKIVRTKECIINICYFLRKCWTSAVERSTSDLRQTTHDTQTLLYIFWCNALVIIRSSDRWSWCFADAPLDACNTGYQIHQSKLIIYLYLANLRCWRYDAPRWLIISKLRCILPTLPGDPVGAPGALPGIPVGTAGRVRIYRNLISPLYRSCRAQQSWAKAGCQQAQAKCLRSFSGSWQAAGLPGSAAMGGGQQSTLTLASVCVFFGVMYVYFVN